MISQLTLRRVCSHSVKLTGIQLYCAVQFSDLFIQYAFTVRSYSAGVFCTSKYISHLNTKAQ